MCGIIATNTSTDPGRLRRSVRHRGTRPPQLMQVGSWQLCHALMPVQGAHPVAQPLVDSHNAMLFQGELFEVVNHDSSVHVQVWF